MPPETLSALRWPGKLSWAGSPGSREGPIDNKPYAKTSAVPSREEPNDRFGGDRAPRENG